MRAAWIAIAGACLAPFALGCGDASNGPTGCDGGDAQASADVLDAAFDAAIDGSGADGEAGLVTDGAGSDAAASPKAYLRVANWSPDAPAVDFCIAPYGTSAFQGPLVGTLAASLDASAPALAFPLVSAYLGLAPAQYDVRLVVSGASSCAVGIGNDLTTMPSLAANAFTTIALLGENVPAGGDPALRVTAFVDGATSTGSVSLRFINAAPALAQATLGTGSLASGKFKPLFSGVAFGTASTSQQAQVPDASTVAVDPHGYILGITLSGATLSAHASGATADAVLTSGLTAAPGASLTIALVGATSAGAPAQLLECVDNAGTAGALSNCMVLP